MSKQRHIIFDLDGTLVDSAPGILAAFSAVLSGRQIEPRCALDNRLIGPPLTETLMRLTGLRQESDLAPLVEDFKHSYDHAGVAATPAYPGIPALITELLSRGASLHIATNKRIVPTRRIVSSLGWNACFSSMYALDSYAPRLPGKAELLARLLDERQLCPDTCIYIGDKQEDGEAADRNALSFVAAGWGYGDFAAGLLPAHWTFAATPAECRGVLLD